ncbi:MAG TPA: PQQ-binding-like beta-propeller repeat protein [Planctomycetota bacterium]|jgi:outer membrane protein assembly factor BamB
MLRWLPHLLAVFGFAALCLWLSMRPSVSIGLRVPEAGPGGGESGKRAPGELNGALTNADGAPAQLPGTWPCFRGPNRDGISTQPESLARSWPAGGPKQLWTIDVGEGYAGAVVQAGRVYMLDYDREKQADALRCMSLADGKDIWRYSYPVVIKRQHGMSRTVPAVTPKYLVSLGPKCQVVCLNPETGALLWWKDLVREFGTTVPPWYAGQNPLIEDARPQAKDEEKVAIIAPGGPEALMVALECATGKVLWKTPNPRGWQMTHVSIVPMTLGGRRSYVYCGSGGVAGIAADTGEILWDTDLWTVKIATISSPVPIEDGRLFFADGYGSGSMMLRLKPVEQAVQPAGAKFTPEVLYRLKPGVFGVTQHAPVLYQNHIYGVRPLPDEKGELVCLDLDGKVCWVADKAKYSFGLGPMMIASGLIYVMDNTGRLVMAEASADSFKPLGDARVLKGNESWGPMALAGTRLIVRDLTKMTCLDVGAVAEEQK